MCVKLKIDFHIHAFPDAIAEKAVKGLVNNVNNLGKELKGIPCTNGTMAAARQYLKNYADVGVLMPIATRSGQQKKVNDWANACQGNGILSFGSVFPFDEEWESELERIKDMGLKGVKLHPDYQKFDVDDKNMYPVYKKISQLGLPVLFHTGTDPVSLDHTHCKPCSLRKVAEDFPDLTVIAAHFGGNFSYNEAKEHILSAGLPNVYVDTSVAYFFADASQLTEGIKLIGADKVLFATDLPWSCGKEAVESLSAADLTSEEFDMIYSLNALKLLNISEDELC